MVGRAWERSECSRTPANPCAPRGSRLVSPDGSGPLPSAATRRDATRSGPAGLRAQIPFVFVLCECCYNTKETLFKLPFTLHGPVTRVSDASKVLFQGGGKGGLLRPPSCPLLQRSRMIRQRWRAVRREHVPRSVPTADAGLLAPQPQIIPGPLASSPLTVPS